jgi:hypothetical protein
MSTTTIRTVASTAPADCHDCGTPGVGTTALERTNFFPRQLVGADDLTQDQIYFREKQRRHNRLLHGWGIVCGAGVTKEGCTAIVAPGYILGPYGDEILIEAETRLDVCRQSSVSSLDCGGLDPWCGDPPRVKDGATVYLAVRYVERRTRPVRVPGCGCGCDESECEYSRIRDGFELAVLTELPASYRDPHPQAATWKASWSCGTGDLSRASCPACPSDPWVLLCDLVVTGGVISDTKCDPHRRYVVSFAQHAFTCDTTKKR